MSSILALIVAIEAICIVWLSLGLYGTQKDLKGLESDAKKYKYGVEAQLAEFAEQISAYHAQKTANDTAPKV